MHPLFCSIGPALWYAFCLCILYSASLIGPALWLWAALITQNSGSIESIKSSVWLLVSTFLKCSSLSRSFIFSNIFQSHFPFLQKHLAESSQVLIGIIQIIYNVGASHQVFNLLCEWHSTHLVRPSVFLYFSVVARFCSFYS